MREHVPPSGIFYWCYSSVYGNYQVAKWVAACGWKSTKEDHFNAITHWLDLELPMPFPISEYDEIEAKRFGFFQKSNNN